MKPDLKRFLLSQLLLACLALAACSPGQAGPAIPTTAGSATSQPSATQIPATATAVPATATSVPPTTRPTQAATAQPTAVKPAGSFVSIISAPQGGIDLFTASPSKLTPLASFPDSQATTARVSPDGRWVGAIVEGGQAVHVVAAGQKTPKFTLAQPKDWQVSNLAFSPDNGKLAYVSLGQLGARAGTMDWRLVVVDLATGKEAVFTSQYTSGDQKTLPGFLVGWQGDNQHVLLDRFVPYSEGTSLGLFSVDVSAAKFGAEAPVPTPHELLSGEYRFPHLSPDGARVGYLARTPGYTPKNFDVVGPGVIPLNEIKVLDLASNQTTNVLTVQDGRALAYLLAWSPDGSQILTGVGSYEVDPNGVSVLHHVGLVASQPGNPSTGSEQPLVTLPDTLAVSDLGWCSADGVYMAAADLTGVPQTQLWFQPLSGAERVVLHDKAQQIQLLGCQGK